MSKQGPLLTKLAYLASLVILALCLPRLGTAQESHPAGFSDATFVKEEVFQILLDAGTSEETASALLRRYPENYNFTGEELQRFLQSIPQEELTGEYARRESLSSLDGSSRVAAGVRRQTPAALPDTALASPDAIRPFGYDVFAYSPLEYAPTADIPVGPDYVLGPGDEVVITIWGNVERDYRMSIGREGNLVLPELGVVPASGLTLDAFEKDLHRRLAGVYSGFNLDVSLGKLRTIQVFVVGDVVRPGAYTITSVSTVFNALYYAGGPSARGSLRRILVYRFGQLVATVDLYDYLLHGDSSGDIRLKSGDTVFVTTIGPTVAVKGAVKRQAVYELKGGERVRDAVGLAGGFTAEAYAKRIEVMRVDRGSGFAYKSVDLSAFAEGDSVRVTDDVPVADGDEVIVHTVWHVYPKKHVFIEGFVQHPGRHALFPGMRVSDLLFEAGGLLDQAYLLWAEVSRIDLEPESSGLVSNLLFVNLEEIMRAPQSTADILLEDRDKVFIRKIPDWRVQHMVSVQGEVRFPGAYALRKKEERLSHVIERAGGLTPQAFPKAGCIYRATQGRVITDFARALAKPGTRDDIVLMDGDSVHVPIYISTVRIEGAVARPGAVVYRAGKNASYYIGKSGGLLELADKGRVRVVTIDGSANRASRRLWFDPVVSPGSVIVVPPREKLEGIDWSSTIKDAASILASMATAIFIIHEMN